MRITLSSNPIDKLSCILHNYLMELKNKHWRKGNYKCTCRICGKTLTSKKDEYCPEECGWMRLKDKKIYDPWICHQCLEHHDSHWIRKEQIKI